MIFYVVIGVGIGCIFVGLCLLALGYIMLFGIFVLKGSWVEDLMSNCL